jgi:serine/threonine protein kinase
LSELAPGVVLGGRFRLQAPLGGGGAAAVWQAHDLEADVAVAVKLLHPKFRAHAGVRARLAQEARLLAEFQHPHLARAVAFALEAEAPYFVLELVRGVSVEEELAERSPAGRHFTTQDFLQMVGQLAGAVDYAHARGVVHRDLKPANVMLAKEGVKVLDFGIAKLLEVTDPTFATTQGRVLGSGFYMAPEQALGFGSLTPRVDIFALGGMVYELLTLRRAWARSADGGPLLAFAQPLRLHEHNRPGVVLTRMADGPRPKVTALRPDLPPEVDDAVARALAPRPEARFETAGALHEALVLALAPASLHDAPTDGVPVVRAGGDTAVRGASRAPTLGLGLGDTVMKPREEVTVAVQPDLQRLRSGPVTPQALDLEGPEPGRTVSGGGWTDTAPLTAGPVLEPTPILASRRRGVPGWVWGVGGLSLGLLLATGWGALRGGDAGEVAPQEVEVQAPPPAVEVTPQPGAVARPAPPPEPADAGMQADLPTRAAPPRAPRPAAPEPLAPAPLVDPARAKMAALVGRLRRDPGDLEALTALNAELERAAAGVSDPARRQRIARLAASAALTGRPDAALEAYGLLEARP